ncbi:MAG: hypothetical protein AB7I19_11400 [Planctomycetota bacterium]
MINQKDNPAAWAMLVHGLDDASEHLAQLVRELTTKEGYGEEEFRIDLGHVYAHLNRAWNSRNITADLTDEEWEQCTEFPKDLDPVG